MDISIKNESFVPQIQQLPINGKDVVVAIEGVKLAIDVVKNIGNAMVEFAKELGVIPNIEVNELGARTIQAMENGIRPEDFATIEEWVNELMKDDWGYNPEISEHLSQEEKVYIGIGTIVAYLVDKFEQLPIKNLPLQFRLFRFPSSLAYIRLESYRLRPPFLQEILRTALCLATPRLTTLPRIHP